MKSFTYKQYIKCIHTLRLSAVLQLAEGREEYTLEDTKKRYFYDKLVKNILKDKKELTKFINQFIAPRQEVKEDELVEYTNNYIAKKYQKREIELIYKLKNQEIFFLIEHQSSIDESVSYRILNYCIDIIQEWTRNKKRNKVKGCPIVVPIIIYTGKQTWRAPRKNKEVQTNYLYEKCQMELDYNLIDINKLSKQMLLKQKSKFALMMLLEKSENTKGLIESIEMIRKTIRNKEKLDDLAETINRILDNILEEKTLQELAKKGGGGKNMSKINTLLDRLAIEDQKYIQLGKQIKQKRIVKNMLNKKIEDKMILEITEIKKEELEEIKSGL